MFGAFPGPQESTQDDLRSPQDGSKIVLDRFFGLLIFCFDFGWVLFDFFGIFFVGNFRHQQSIELGRNIQIEILKPRYCWWTKSCITSGGLRPPHPLHRAQGPGLGPYNCMKKIS